MIIYSERSASIGSTEAARRAGKQGGGRGEQEQSGDRHDDRHVDRLGAVEQVAIDAATLAAKPARRPPTTGRTASYRASA